MWKTEIQTTMKSNILDEVCSPEPVAAEQLGSMGQRFTLSEISKSDIKDQSHTVSSLSLISLIKFFLFY